MLLALAQENLNRAERAAVPALIRCNGTAQYSEPRFREALVQNLSCVKHNRLPQHNEHPGDLPRPTDSANAFRADGYRLTTLFGECLYFEWRGRPAADLLEEEI
jgi:hypothetical protein